MFTDEDTKTTIHADLDCSVIHATMRPQDLIPAFLEVIRDTAEYAQLMALPFQPWTTDDDDAEYWQSEECSFFLNDDLFETLNNYAPDGYYFRSHPGDGSDYGYWAVTEDM